MGWPSTLVVLLIIGMLPHACSAQQASAIPVRSASHSRPIAKGNRNTSSSEASPNWPRSEALLEKLDALATDLPQQSLLDEVRAGLNQLSQATRLGAPEASRHLARLELISRQLRQQALQGLSASRGDAHQHQSFTNLLRFSYALDRRLVIWAYVQQSLVRSSGETTPSPEHQPSYEPLVSGDVAPEWTDYLLLQETESVLGSDKAKPSQKKKVARKVLARITSPLLNADQIRYLQSTLRPEGIASLKHYAIQPVDYRRFLEAIERFDHLPSGYHAYRLNNHYHNLIWSENLDDQMIGQELKTYYRNANVRIAVSKKLLNRLIPQRGPTLTPIARQMFGADVRGQNRISRHLQVNLIPDAQRLHLELEAIGHVHSTSVATRKGFTVHNRGTAQFQVAQQIIVGLKGIEPGPPPIANSNAHQQMVGLESDYDTIPVVARIARRGAQNKVLEQNPEAERIIEDEIRNQAIQQMSGAVATGLQRMQQRYFIHLFQPLMKLDLPPEPVQLKTTADRLVVRYRLAGHDQMAAHTARPYDDPSSLISLQLHESALNNAIARLGLNGKTFTPQQLAEHLRSRLKLPPPQTESPSGAAADQKAEIRFAHFDPVRVEFTNDRVRITLNLQSLQVGSGKRWKRISITSAYRIQQQGLTVRLIQDETGTRIQGSRLRFGDRAAISTIHKVLFEREYSFPLLPRKLADRIAAQRPLLFRIFLSEGWVSVDVQDAPLVASRTENRADRLPLRK